MTDRKDTAFTKAVRFIWDNIDQPIKLEEIAIAAEVSLSSLKRIFADTAHKTPGEFIRRLRMESAFRSLQSRNDTVLEEGEVSPGKVHLAQVLFCFAQFK